MTLRNPEQNTVGWKRERDASPAHSPVSEDDGGLARAIAASMQQQPSVYPPPASLHRSTLILPRMQSNHCTRSGSPSRHASESMNGCRTLRQTGKNGQVGCLCMCSSIESAQKITSL